MTKIFLSCKYFTTFVAEAYHPLVMNLSQFKNIPISYDELISQLNGYNAPKNKVQEMERSGQIIRLKKGVYVLSKQVSGIDPLPELVANHLHGPSYISMQTALRYYGLIPEHVYPFKSMTLGRSCEFSNPIGLFSYVHTTASYYSIGLTSLQSDNACFLIATPEKALCDLIVTSPGIQLRSVSSVMEFLEQYLRFDMDSFSNMDAPIFEECAAKGKKSQTLYNILKVLRR